jgi:hypothetical protein
MLPVKALAITALLYMILGMAWSSRVSRSYQRQGNLATLTFRGRGSMPMRFETAIMRCFSIFVLVCFSIPIALHYWAGGDFPGMIGSLLAVLLSPASSYHQLLAPARTRQNNETAGGNQE